jgi:hypothetical protein
MMEAVRTSETSVDNHFLEAVRTSETSVDIHFTRQYNPEDSSEHHIVVLLERRLWHAVNAQEKVKVKATVV